MPAVNMTYIPKYIIQIISRVDQLDAHNLSKCNCVKLEENEIFRYYCVFFFFFFFFFFLVVLLLTWTTSKMLPSIWERFH